MAFVASTTSRVLVPGGSVATVAVPIPQVIDVSGNGYTGLLFSHYVPVSVGSVGGGINQTLSVISGGANAIPPGATSINVITAVASDMIVLFGKMD